MSLLPGSLNSTVPEKRWGGVLGVLPGIIGSLQASEVIKVITGVGETLSGRFFTFDALTFETRTFNIKRRDVNPLNGKNPAINALIDYEQFCGVKAVEKPIKEISANTIRALEEKFGFTNLYNLKGGIFAFIDDVQPELKKY